MRLVILFVFVALASSATPPRIAIKPSRLLEPISSVQGLIGRVLGASFVDFFNLETIPASTQGNDVFEVDVPPASTVARVTLRGNTGVALASAFHHYLKYWCNNSVSWGVDGTGDNLVLPDPLPSPTAKTREESPVQFRYYMNVCTVSYSMAFWDWSRWEREIDWMAMEGINLALTFTGQEYVWAKMFTDLGMTEAELEPFFAGPAFLAWQRMGNIHGWPHGVTPAWREAQMQLNKQILARQRELGIVSVLPGFAGHVPAALKRLYPDANMTQSAAWGNFNHTYTDNYLLQPLDPLFKKLGFNFLEAQNAVFGSDHIYNMDTFNEMNPSSTDPEYLADSAAAIFEAVTSYDPNGVWLMQGWLFLSSFWTFDRTKAYLSKVPDNRMIILDLATANRPVWDKYESFFGKPWIWCMLHNYGGRRGVYGNMTRIATGPVEDKHAQDSTMIGTGITMEAIEQNPVIYELMLEMGWHEQSVDVPSWIERYVERRYSVGYVHSHPDLQKAWTSLLKSPYSYGMTGSLFENRPRLLLNCPANSAAPADINAAWEALASAGVDGGNNPLRYDTVDIARQGLANLFMDALCALSSAYLRAFPQSNGGFGEAFPPLPDLFVPPPLPFVATQSLPHQQGDTTEVEAWGTFLTGIVDDLQTLLQSDPNFMLGHWQKMAESWASTTTAAEIEFNARNQLTLWGPSGQILDYASKQWAGLTKDFFKMRWGMFVDSVVDAVKTGKAVDWDAWNEGCLAKEQEWNVGSQKYPTDPTGDAFTIAVDLSKKYTQSSGQYTVVPNMDAYGNDLFGPTWTRDVAQLKLICDTDPLCAGFNSNGWFKKDVSTTKPSKSTLYVKQS